MSREKVERNLKMVKEYKKGKKGYKKLAKDFGVHYSIVARVVKMYEKREKKRDM